MTQEDKDLLLKDLSARLCYDVVCQVEFKSCGKYDSKAMLLTGIFKDEAFFTSERGSIYSNEYKPYLFPLSSMTEKQKIELTCIIDSDHAQIDWYNKNHFDYRGLIEKGLAIDATGLNIY